MRQFMLGVGMGAIAMYLYLEGTGPVVGIVQGWWVEMSRPRAAALQQ